MKLNYFKEKLNFCFGLSSLIGLLFTTISSLYIIKESSIHKDFMILIVTLAVTNIFLGFIATSAFIIIIKNNSFWKDSISTINNKNEEIKGLKRSLESEIQIQERLTKFFHNFSHEHRKIVSAMNIDLSTRDITKFDERKHSFKMFILYTLENIKYIYDNITNDDCAVSIKLLRYGKVFDKSKHPDVNTFIHKSKEKLKNPEFLEKAEFLIDEQCFDEDKNLLAPEQFLDETWLVKTYFRDPISYRRRSISDRELPCFPYYCNTAFDSILDERKTTSFFFSNNLESEEKKGKYQNKSPKWKRYYNACLVVPIRYIECITEVPGEESFFQKEHSSVVGFLCVDNIKGGFKHPFTTDNLASVGDHFYNLFKTYASLVDLFEKESQLS